MPVQRMAIGWKTSPIKVKKHKHDYKKLILSAKIAADVNAKTHDKQTRPIKLKMHWLATQKSGRP